MDILTLSGYRTIKKFFLCWLFAAGCLVFTPLTTGSLTTTKSIVTIPIVTKHNTKVNTFCHKNTHPLDYDIWTNVTFFKIITFSHRHTQPEPETENCNKIVVFLAIARNCIYSCNSKFKKISVAMHKTQAPAPP